MATFPCEDKLHAFCITGKYKHNCWDGPWPMNCLVWNITIAAKSPQWSCTFIIPGKSNMNITCTQTRQDDYGKESSERRKAVARKKRREEERREEKREWRQKVGTAIEVGWKGGQWERWEERRKRGSLGLAYEERIGLVCGDETDPKTQLPNTNSQQEIPRTRSRSVQRVPHKEPASRTRLGRQ